MDKNQLSRQLAVILHADVVGSTKLVQLDETLAHRRMQFAFNLFSEIIESYGGKSREIRGDALVAEFARSSDAVAAAMVFQSTNQACNEKHQDSVRPILRIGISMGEVIIADGTITGSGVVLSQRLEQLASSGGVVVQGSVAETVPTRMPFNFESLGEKKLKGFDQPVRAFTANLQRGRSLPEPEPDVKFGRDHPANNGKTSKPSSENTELSADARHPSTFNYKHESGRLLRFIKAQRIAVLVVVLATAGTLGFLIFNSADNVGSNDIIPAKSRAKSLAVLPFLNLSSEIEVSFITSGFGEDLTTDLSKVPGLTVIAYASSFDYLNAESGFREIAKKLGVNYLVRGTVRSDAEQLRINVALIDPIDGLNIWSERYDRSRENPFDVQEEVTQEIIDALSLSLDVSSISKKEVNPDAHYMLLRGLDPLRALSSQGNEEARYFFNRALAFDPSYARAHANIAVSYGRDSLLPDLKGDRSDIIGKGLESAITSIQLDPSIPNAYLALGLLNLSLREYDKAISAARHSIALDANYADGFALLAEAVFYAGDLDEALASVRRAKLLHPHHPPSYHWIEGQILYQQGKYQEALDVLTQAVELSPDFQAGVITLIATYAQLGQVDSATDFLNQIEESGAEFDYEKSVEEIPFNINERRDALIRGLKKTNVGI